MAESHALTKYIKNSYHGNDGGIIFVSKKHHIIDIGKYFNAFTRSTASDTQKLELGITIPNDTAIDYHILLIIDVAAATEWELYESNVYSGGTTLAKFNGNRNSTEACPLIYIKNPVVTTTGTKIDGGLVGGNGFKSVIGGEDGDEDGIIAKNNSQYIFRASSRSTGNIIYLKAKTFQEDI